MDEAWRSIPFFDGRYEVSDAGRVRSLRTGRVLSQHLAGSRQPRVFVTLWRDGERVQVYVHRLVLLVFVGSPPTLKHQGAHGDGNPSNNHLSNLRWATPHENMLDRDKHGTIRCDAPTVARKLTPDQARAIRARVMAGESPTAVAAAFGTSRENARDIGSGRRWSWLSLAPATRAR